MRRPGSIDDHGALPSAPQVETAGAQGGGETGVVMAPAPGRQDGPAHRVEVDRGALLLLPLGRRERGDGSGRFQGTGTGEPVGHLRATLLAEVAGDGAGMLRGDRRHAEFELDDPAALLAAGVIPGEVDHGPGGAHEAVDAVLVATVLAMLHPPVRLRFQAELRLEQTPPPRPCASLVRDPHVGVEMHVVDGPVRAPAQRDRDEFADLSDEIRAAEAAGRDDRDDLVLGLQEVPGERVAGPAPARGPPRSPPGLAQQHREQEPPGTVQTRPARPARPRARSLLTEASSRTAAEIAATSSRGKFAAVSAFYERSPDPGG